MGRTAKQTDDQKAAVRQRAAEDKSKTKLPDEYEISRATLYAVFKAA